MVDYSRFNHIDTDSEDDDSPSLASNKKIGEGMFDNSHNSNAVHTLPPPPPPVQTTSMTQKGQEGRLKFEYDGRTIFEWEQSLDEVNIYVVPPPGVTKAMISIVISHRHLLVGLKGTNPYLDEETGGPVKPDESYWMLIDNEININLQKMNKAERWECALVGKASKPMDPFTAEEVKKKLMIERFQEEHPAFDFSNAEFNGMVPDAREFLGGVRYR